MKTIVTKAEYAVLKGRQPSSVSNWIADGKISPAALIGDGPRARIWVEQADADLARSLDPVQQAAQARPITLSPSSPALQSPRSGIAAATDDKDILRRRKADADKAEHDAEAARRKLMVDEGRWISAAAAMRDWGRELARIVGDFETFLCNTLARETAERFGLDWKEISAAFRESYRKRRVEIAEAAKAEREQIEAREIDAEGQ